MINQFTLKQKMIVGVVLGVIMVGVGIYGFLELGKPAEEIDFNAIVGAENQIISNGSTEEETSLNDSSNPASQNNLNQEAVEETIIVHITGEVKKSGILELKEGSRIADAIQKAGGATKNADLDSINLAYIVQDGQKIYVPNKNEKNDQKEYITTGSGNNVIDGKENNSQGGIGKVNINEATQAELETLPGIGPSIASKIIEYRQQNGKFSKIEDLQNVKGIGDAKFADMKDYVTVK